MKFALVLNNLVVRIVEAEAESEINGLLHRYQAALDITEATPEPQVGWVFENNELVAATSEYTPDQMDLIQQQAQRKYGHKICDTYADLVGARNFKLARENTPVNVASLAGQLLSLKTLLQGGALKTARTATEAMKVAHPTHADIFDLAIADITSFLIQNGWN